MPIFLINLLISVALSVASTLVQMVLAQNQKQKQPGVRGTIDAGGDNPPSFILGLYGTAGQFVYAGSWGDDGDTPNAFYTRVISVSDMPVTRLNGLFVNGERGTILPTTGNPFPWFPIPDSWFNAIGNPVEQFRKDGKDHLWVQFYDGTQTTPNAFLRQKFGNDPDRPWQDDMIGRGVAYVVVTALVNRELFISLPEYMVEIEGSKLYDPRQDSTAGGNGGQRVDSPATWAYSDNPMVGIYNVLLGFHFEGQWFYGPQGITQNRLPYANWAAQMDKCDAPIALAGGGSEKRYRFGMEIVLDDEPHATIGELLNACDGRIAEIGGTYKVLVGGPDAPVVSFTDEDVVISEGQSYEPFPGLEATHNGITATYPEPAEGWENKEAPPRYRSDLEAKDDGRRLLVSANYRAVPYGNQVQRHMKATIEEARRFRKHSHTMPPAWWEYEPLDASAWSSERNGYNNKLFLLTAMDDLPNGKQLVGYQEQDPSDYDWSSDLELPWNVQPITAVRPTPQEVAGFYVLPAAVLDDQGRPRHPAIDVFWNGLEADVRAVRITTRLNATDELVWEGEAPRPALGSARVSQNLLPNQSYEVQIQYQPFSGRETVPSAWLSVTTPDIRISLEDINDEFRDVTGILLGDGKGSLTENLRDLKDMIIRSATSSIVGQVEGYRERKEMVAVTNDVRAYFLHEVATLVSADEALVTELTQLTATVGENEASLIEFNLASVNRDQALSQQITLLDTDFEGNKAAVAVQLTALSTKDTALAQLINEVAIEIDGVSAQGLFSMKAIGAPSGVSVRLAILARKNSAEAFIETGFIIDIFPDNATQIAIKADSFYLLNSTGGKISSPFSVVGGVVYMSDVVVDGDLIVSGSINTAAIANQAVTFSNVAKADNEAELFTSAGATTVLSLYVPASGNKTIVHANVFLWGSGGIIQLKLFKDGVEKDQITTSPPSSPRVSIALLGIDENPSDGTWFITVHSQTAAAKAVYADRYIHCFNGKR